MIGEVEQCGAHRSRRTDDEDFGARRELAVAREHLERGEIGEGNAHCLGRIDAVGHSHEKLRGAYRILGVGAYHAQIGDGFAFAERRHSGPDLFDNPHKLVARRKRQRPLEVGITAVADKDIREAGAGREHFDAHFAHARLGNGRLLDEFENLGPAEAGNADVLKAHASP